MKCMCFKKRISLKKEHKKDYYLKKGQERLNKDINVVDVVRVVHLVEILVSVLFDKNE